MTTFQLFLLIVAGGVFYLFFKQLFSGSYPKRGVDFEAKLPDERIGGINRPDKTFSKPPREVSRIEQLIEMADEAIGKGDLLEARKAVQSALILNENNIEALRREGYLYLEDREYEEARKVYEKILSLDPSDEIAHDSLANTLHKLGEDESAQRHHQKAIELDPEYAPHYFNYANTLYDLGMKAEALQNYEKAYELDNTIEEAKKMIDELKESR
jgi:tetratricopeptide (TPR) repeat protein